eukprot:CAMPEP_0201495238 /NCGR_PEP_ID=MMETSP0151_2-20130828/52759_1 /ASSEMBLY_ACC=CAM_ASM_000257 /TAXON_ID=200890 /ORGANISM="Paramoeba atlantica, Strain 621/1 / CCAP 1560/9" /LENGTH=563 /DNA_ID=CAMNT_0047884089 /DNA_START=23 /DNA_END=1711 /DNA_ORIENTATION=+
MSSPVTLEELMKRQGCGYIPLLVEDCLNFISQSPFREGLFSSPGDAFIAHKIFEAYAREEKVTIAQYTTDPYTICDLLLLFLRRLPQPLLPTNKLNEFAVAARTENFQEVRRMCDALGEYPHALADCIFQFLHEGLEKRSFQLKNLWQIGPIVFRSDTKEANDTGEYLVRRAPELFGILKLQKFSSVFEMKNEIIGKGAYALVQRGVFCETGEAFAVKEISRKVIKKDRLEAEVSILMRVRHPNIVCLRYVSQTEQTLYLVFDLAERGDLLDHLSKFPGGYTEARAIEVATQMFQAVSYLHRSNIVHRDIKPENILIKNENPFQIQLTDFGLSKILEQDVETLSLAGSPSYIAPEIIENARYGFAVDMWSSGVVVFVLLSGKIPWTERHFQERFQQIVRAEYNFCSVEWNFVSPNAKNFISRLLVVDPERRMTAEEGLAHQWLMGKQDNFFTPPSLESPTNKDEEDFCILEETLERPVDQAEMDTILNGGGGGDGDGERIPLKESVFQEEEEEVNGECAIVVGEELDRDIGEPKREHSGRRHHFRNEYFIKPAWCEVCEKRMW